MVGKRTITTTTTATIAALLLLASKKVNTQRLRSSSLHGGSSSSHNGEDVSITPTPTTYSPTSQPSSFLPTTLLEEPLNLVRVRSPSTSSNNGIISGSKNKNECGEHQQLFQLEVYTVDTPCETSWVLERIVEATGDGIQEHHDINEDNEDSTRLAYIDGHKGSYFDTPTAGSSTRCLDRGQYKFTIHDEFGDGITSPGYYTLALDGVILKDGSNDDFGYEEITQFSVGVTVKEVVEVVESIIVLQDEDNVATSVEEEEEVMKPLEEDIPDADEESYLVNLEEVTTTAMALSSQDDETISLAETVSTASTSKTNESQAVDQSSDTEEPSDAITAASSPSTQEESSQWMELLLEDFEHDLGHFHAGSIKDSEEYITYYPFVKERKGVVRLQNEHNDEQNDDGKGASISTTNKDRISSNIYSDNIAIDTSSYEEIKLLFSFYANSMEQSHNDGFCLDYSIDDGMTWHSKQCWHAIQDFDNNVWYDDIEVTFNELNDVDLYNDANGVQGMRLRFRCETNSLNDDVLLDKVQLLGLVKQTHLKDSI